MANLAKTQAAWTKFFTELGLLGCLVKVILDFKRRFSLTRARTQLVEFGDNAAAASAWTLSGVVIGTNTSRAGKIFIRRTDESPGANQVTFDLYKATGGGGGDKVATGSGNNGATITLSASNSSGLTGTVVAGTVTASDTTDTHYLYVVQDFVVRLRTVLDGSEPEHGRLDKRVRDALVAIESAAEDAFSAATSLILDFLALRGKTFAQSGTTTAIAADTSEDEGSIATVYTGVLESVRDAMEDDGTAGEQEVVKNAVTAASVSFDASNTGEFTMATPTMEEWARPGRLTCTCVSDSIPERFSVCLSVSGQDDPAETREASNELTVGRPFTDPKLGIRSALLLRALEITDPDSGANFNTTASNWSVSGESQENTDDGVIYLKVVASGGSWIVYGYSSSTRSSDTMVFETAAAAAGASTSIVATNGSGLSGTVKVGSAPTNNDTGSLDLHFAKVQNGAGVPDSFSSVVTVASRGEFQELVALLFDYALNSDTSGGETISDELLTAGSFPPYEVRDA